MAEYPHRTEHHDHDDHLENQKPGRNHSADSSCFGEVSPGWIHPAAIHLLQVTIAHHPRRDAKKWAQDEAKNAKNQNHDAPMWFNILVPVEKVRALDLAGEPEPHLRST